MNASRRPPPPEAVAPKHTAKSVGAGLNDCLAPDTKDVGPIVGNSLASMIAQAERDEARRRLPYLFTLTQREFFDDFRDEEIAVLRALLRAEQRRVALWEFWRAQWKWAVPVAGAAFAWGSGFLEKYWPYVGRILKAIAEAPPA